MLSVATTLRSFIKKRTQAADTHMERTKTHRSSRRLHNCLWKIPGLLKEALVWTEQHSRGLNLPTRGRLPPPGVWGVGLQTSRPSRTLWIDFVLYYGGHRMIFAVRFPTVWQSALVGAVSQQMLVGFSLAVYIQYGVCNAATSGWT